VNYIRVGNRTNIQDGSVLHVTRKTAPCIVGDNVTVGHKVILHGCTIESNCLIGMGSIVMDRAVVGPNSILGAGSVVTEGKIIPAGWLAYGSPAKAVRELTPEELAFLPRSADNYVNDKENYRQADR
jgi:carbonic anhydrase/acetyltransferase-like protein (isoleucine patch superfamily)